MRAAITMAPGGPIEVEDVPDPVRRAGEVLVRVYAASVNRLDRAVFEGKALGAAARFPLIQGIDAAGVIEEGTGSLATGLRVVIKPMIACRRCRWCRMHRPADCADSQVVGIHRQGGHAELVAVPRTNVFVLPSELTFAEGAAAAHTHAVVLHMIRAAGDLPDDATVMVTGAGGALGTAAVQLASALGYRVVAIASSTAKLERVAEMGASMVANRTELGSLAEAVCSATDGGVDLVLETTGFPPVVEDAVECLARGGRLVTVAAVPGATATVDLQALYRGRRSLIGTAGSNDADFMDTYRLLKEYEVHPVIARTFPLEQAGEAMEAVLDRNRVGKVVIEVGGGS